MIFDMMSKNIKQNVSNILFLILQMEFDCVMNIVGETNEVILLGEVQQILPKKE